MQRLWRAARAGCAPARTTPLGSAAVARQGRTYYWWDSHDSVDAFKARLEFILRSEGVENPRTTVDRLMKSRRVHSLRDVSQHSLTSLKYYVQPSSVIGRVYRRIQREIGNEFSSTQGKTGQDRDEQAEGDDGKLSAFGTMMHQRGVVDPRVLRYSGPNPNNFRRHSAPEHHEF